jgi:hypothetical protein
MQARHKIPDKTGSFLTGHRVPNDDIQADEKSAVSFY